MKKLDKFVLKSFIGPLVLTFFIVLFILILQFLWMYIDELAGKGLQITVLAELLFHFSLTFVPLALPLAVLLASLMTYGNMGEFSELAALKSSGIPLRRIMLPIVFLVSIVCGISFFFSNNVQPYAYRKARTLLFDIRRKRPELNIQAGTFNNDVDGFSMKIGAKDPFSSKLEKILIYDHRDKSGNRSVIYADSGYMKVTHDESGMIMTLFNGYSYNDLDEKNVSNSNKKYPFRRDTFREQSIIISLSGFDLERSKEDMFKLNSSTQTVIQLVGIIDSINKINMQKRLTYFRDFNTTKLYTQGNAKPKTGTSLKADSLKPRPKPYFDARKLLDSVPHFTKKEAMQKALESARYCVNFINQKEEFMHNDVKIVRNYQIDLHKKFTMAFTCLIFFLIGAPLGAIIRKGGLGTPAVISILFFVVYYVITISAEKFVKEDIMNTFFGLWSACFILLPIGIFLTYKATTDSMIFNTETYMHFFKKIKNAVWRIIFNVKHENTPSD
jgi:lipopolysaccharide export system permease protein